MGTLGAALVGAPASAVLQLGTVRTRCGTAWARTVAAPEDLPEGPARDQVPEIVRQQVGELRLQESETDQLGNRLRSIPLVGAGAAFAGGCLRGLLGEPRVIVLSLFSTALIAPGSRTSDVMTLVVVRPTQQFRRSR